MHTLSPILLESVAVNTVNLTECSLCSQCLAPELRKDSLVTVAAWHPAPGLLLLGMEAPWHLPVNSHCSSACCGLWWHWQWKLSAGINERSIWHLLCAQPWNKGGSSELGANHFHDSCHGAQLLLDCVQCNGEKQFEFGFLPSLVGCLHHLFPLWLLSEGCIPFSCRPSARLIQLPVQHIQWIWCAVQCCSSSWFVPCFTSVCHMKGVWSFKHQEITGNSSRLNYHINISLCCFAFLHTNMFT